jgi:hypothetical protein
MRYIVKGDAMESGGRATAQSIPSSGRYAVGLFGGDRYETSGSTGYGSGRPGPSFPPRTVVLVKLAER